MHYNTNIATARDEGKTEGRVESEQIGLKKD
jgi:hypothetical protein